MKRGMLVLGMLLAAALLLAPSAYAESCASAPDSAPDSHPGVVLGPATKCVREGPAVAPGSDAVTTTGSDAATTPIQDGVKTGTTTQAAERSFPVSSIAIGAAFLIAIAGGSIFLRRRMHDAPHAEAA